MAPSILLAAILRITMWAKRKQGFTIVELLIVIVVIAILAAITIIAYNGIQQRARLSQSQAVSAQVQKSIELFRAEKDSYPAAINSCPNPVDGSTCVVIPSGFSSTYERIPQGARPSPVYAGTTSAQSYEITLRSNTSVIYRSNAERTGVNEFLQYMNMASIIDNQGLKPYQISFDIKSANISTASTVNLYMQNGSGSKYSFSVNIPVTTSYVRRTVTVTPTLWDGTLTDSVLSFFGTYNTGNIPSVKNLEIIQAN